MRDNVILQFNHDCMLVKIKAVLAGSGGKVIGVYKPSKWYDATTISPQKRIAFEGREITDDVKYLHKLLPVKYFPCNNNPYCYTF
jgi:hypothetical protein